jgi:argininosuccinate lyase
MAHAIPSVEFKPDNISLDPSLYAAEKANALVLSEGIPFREAYRRIAAELKLGGNGE